LETFYRSKVRATHVKNDELNLVKNLNNEAVNVSTVQKFACKVKKRAKKWFNLPVQQNKTNEALVDDVPP
jgi:hypothetical protein